MTWLLYMDACTHFHHVQELSWSRIWWIWLAGYIMLCKPCKMYTYKTSAFMNLRSDNCPYQQLLLSNRHLLVFMPAFMLKPVFWACGFIQFEYIFISFRLKKKKQGCSTTRDNIGEPLVTSFHSKFMGTVDYIWWLYIQGFSYHYSFSILGADFPFDYSGILPLLLQ